MGLRLRSLLGIYVFFIFGIPAFASDSAFDSWLGKIRAKAVRQSPEIAIARQNYSQHRAQQFTAWARWLPRVDFQLSQNIRRDYSLLSNGTLPAIFGNLVPGQANYAEWAVNASVPLYRRSVHLNIEQAAGEKTLASREVDQALAELDWRMRELVGKYLLGRYKVEALANSLQIAESESRETKLRFDLGDRTQIDVLRARANLVSLESRRLLYQQEQASALSALLEFSGLAAEDPEFSGLEKVLDGEMALANAIESFTTMTPVLSALEPVVGDVSAQKPITPKLEAEQRMRAEQRLREFSPSYQTTAAEAELQESRAKTLMVSEWPQLDLQGSVYKLSSQWGDLFSSNNQSYMIGITLTIPIFSGGSLFTTYSEEHSAMIQSRLKSGRDSLRLAHEVGNQLLQIKALQRQLDSFKVSLEQNIEILRLSTESYQLGQETLVNLLSSQNQWTEAKISVAQSKIDLSVVARHFAANLGVTIP